MKVSKIAKLALLIIFGTSSDWIIHLFYITVLCMITPIWCIDMHYQYWGVLNNSLPTFGGFALFLPLLSSPRCFWVNLDHSQFSYSLTVAKCGCVISFSFKFDPTTVKFNQNFGITSLVYSSSFYSFVNLMYIYSCAASA